jgi:ppGpp synthetase/RelA/SpoT-type nucleotidyltranferase
VEGSRALSPDAASAVRTGLKRATVRAAQAMLNEQILTDYSAARPALVTLGAQLEAQLQGLVHAHALPAQFVTHRIKSFESLRRKVSRPDRSYRRLWDLTDLVGLRVAAYFEDTLEPLARLIEGHFAVDFNHSTDKQRFTEDGRFGYRSLHYVCALPEGPDPHFRFEIQLRTVLQHAWAEVEHDLGYQAANAVPERIKRRFARIASLLEIADQEFVAIKSELRDYQATVQQALARPGEVLRRSAGDGRFGGGSAKRTRSSTSGRNITR